MKTSIISSPCKTIGRLSIAICVLIMISSCSFDATKRRYNNGWNLNFAYKNIGLDLPENKAIQKEKSIIPPSQDSLLIYQQLVENSLASLPPSKLFEITHATQPYQLSHYNNTPAIEKYTDMSVGFNNLTQDEFNSIEKRHNKRYMSIFYKFIVSLVGIVLGIFTLIVAEILWLDSLFLLGFLLVFFSIIFMLALLFTLAITNKEDPNYERYLRRYLQLGLASVFLLGLFLSPLFFIIGYRSKDKFVNNRQSNQFGNDKFGSNYDTAKIILTISLLVFAIFSLVVYGSIFFFFI